MDRDLVLLKVESELVSIRRDLKYSLKSLVQDAQRALDNLEKSTPGEPVHMDTNLIKNRMEVDSLSSSFNRLSEIMAYLQAEATPLEQMIALEENATVGAGASSPSHVKRAVNSPSAPVQGSGGRRR